MASCFICGRKVKEWTIEQRLIDDNDFCANCLEHDIVNPLDLPEDFKGIEEAMMTA